MALLPVPLLLVSLLSCPLRAPRARVAVLFKNDDATYSGGLLGVAASVRLDRARQSATITLRGAPVGGTLAGEARFSPSGAVELDAELARALKRRFVAIERAGEDLGAGVVWVVVRLPLGLGRHTLRLERVI